MSVPATFLNGEPFVSGRTTIEEILARLDTNVQAKAAEKLAAKDVFDVLIVGGGPAGSAAAIYAARKGIRTGVVAERFGGGKTAVVEFPRAEEVAFRAIPFKALQGGLAAAQH